MLHKLCCLIAATGWMLPLGIVGGVQFGDIARLPGFFYALACLLAWALSCREAGAFYE